MVRKITSSDATVGCDPANRSAILTGNRIKLTLTTSGGAVLTETNDIIYMELDPNTISGTFKSVGRMGSRAHLSVVHISDEVTVNPASCPYQCQWAAQTT